MLSAMRRFEVNHLIAGAVAICCVAFGLAGGGFEATAFAAAGLLVWIAAIAAVGIGIVPRSVPPREAAIAGVGLAGLAGLLALSLAWSSDDGAGFSDVV